MSVSVSVSVRVLPCVKYTQDSRHSQTEGQSTDPDTSEMRIEQLLSNLCPHVLQ